MAKKRSQNRGSAQYDEASAPTNAPALFGNGLGTDSRFRTASECVTLQTGHFGCRAIFHSPWSARIAEYLSSKEVVELELNVAKGWRGQDLSFLAALPGLLVFEIFSFGIQDISPIHTLHNLKKLGVTTYCLTELDFSAFPKLESCSLEWRPKAKSLFDCITLTDLFVNRYKGQDTASFAKLRNLESLGLYNASIKDLHGLSELKALRLLSLAALRGLSSLSGIENLTGLAELEMNTCRRINSIEQVRTLTNLRKLYLTNMGDIESLKPLENLNRLESVAFPQSTNIKDGDLWPLLRHKKLLRVAFQNRRHYSHLTAGDGKLIENMILP